MGVPDDHGRLGDAGEGAPVVRDRAVDQDVLAVVARRRVAERDRCFRLSRVAICFHEA